MTETPVETFRYWLITLEVIYEKDGAIRQRKDNTFLTSAEDNIGLHILNNARFMYLQDFCEATGLKPEDIKNFVFINITNLGRMTDEEFSRVPVFSEESDQESN